jgi:hypothetical protein
MQVGESWTEKRWEKKLKRERKLSRTLIELISYRGVTVRIGLLRLNLTIQALLIVAGRGGVLFLKRIDCTGIIYKMLNGPF